MTKKKHDVVIVGAGLFGSIAATLARAHGHRVTVIDNAAPWAASKCSGCVLAPSWLASLTKAEIATAMGVLNDLYTVHALELHSNVLGKVFKAQRVDPDKVLVKPDSKGTVLSTGSGGVQTAGSTFKGKVLIAAGMHCTGLVPGMPRMKGLWGSSARFKAQLPEDLISVYAPYRQAVMFNLNRSTVWGGDGTALIEKTWRAEETARRATTAARLMALAKLKTLDFKMFSGARPYVEGHKGGYFQRVDKNTWVSTGGAKNGTILAALQAHKFVEALNASH